jgi:hypothetical protein
MPLVGCPDQGNGITSASVKTTIPSAIIDRMTRHTRSCGDQRQVLVERFADGSVERECFCAARHGHLRERNGGNEE